MSSSSLDTGVRVDLNIDGRHVPYQIERVLGQGSKARTFIATRQGSHPSAPDEVVLKASIDELRGVERAKSELQAEFDILTQLHVARAHVPQPWSFHDGASEPTIPFFAMARAAGDPISQVALKGARYGFPEKVAMALAIPFLETLEAAHKSGFGYRDWDATNVFVASNSLPAATVPASRGAKDVEAFRSEEFLHQRPVTVIDWNVVDRFDGKSEAERNIVVAADVRKFFRVWFELLAGTSIPSGVQRDRDAFDRLPILTELSDWARDLLGRGLGVYQMAHARYKLDTAQAVLAELRAGVTAWDADLGTLVSAPANEESSARGRRTAIGRVRHELLKLDVPASLTREASDDARLEEWKKEITQALDAIGGSGAASQQSRLPAEVERLPKVSVSDKRRVECWGIRAATLLLMQVSSDPAAPRLARMVSQLPLLRRPNAPSSGSATLPSGPDANDQRAKLVDACLRFDRALPALRDALESARRHDDHQSEEGISSLDRAIDVLNAIVVEINGAPDGENVSDLLAAFASEEDRGEARRLLNEATAHTASRRLRDGFVQAADQIAQTAAHGGSPSPLGTDTTGYGTRADPTDGPRSELDKRFNAEYFEVQPIHQLSMRDAYWKAQRALREAEQKWSQSELRERIAAMERKRREAERSAEEARQAQLKLKREAELHKQLEAWRQALRDGRLALVVRDGGGSAAEDQAWRQTVTAMADAWVALREEGQIDDEWKEVEGYVSRFLMAFTTIEPLSGAWLRFDHVRAEGKRVGMAVTVPVQVVEGALKNRLDVRWKPLFDRARTLARELLASELAALGPTVAQEREATLVALAAEVATLRQEFDRWPTVTQLTTVMGPMASQLVTLEKATTQVRALRERQAALRGKWDAAGDDVAAQVAVLDEAAREKVRFYDAPDDLPATLGAQFRQALRITVPAQVPESAASPRIIGQTPGSGSRIVTGITPRQATTTAQTAQSWVTRAGSVEPQPNVNGGEGQRSATDGATLSPSHDSEAARAPDAEAEARPAAEVDASPVDNGALQDVLRAVRTLGIDDTHRQIERTQWLEVCRKERALARGREGNPKLEPLRSVRQQLLRAAYANGMRWGTEALLTGGSDRGREHIDEVRTLVDELKAVEGPMEAGAEPWSDWEAALAKRVDVERQVAAVRQKVIGAANYAQAGREFEAGLSEVIRTTEGTSWGVDVAGWLQIMRVHMKGKDQMPDGGALLYAVNRRLNEGRVVMAPEALQLLRNKYQDSLKTKAGEQIKAISKRRGSQQLGFGDQYSLQAWRRLEATPEEDWFDAFAANVAKR